MNEKEVDIIAQLAEDIQEVINNTITKHNLSVGTGMGKEVVDSHEMLLKALILIIGKFSAIAALDIAISNDEDVLEKYKEIVNLVNNEIVEESKLELEYLLNQSKKPYYNA